jgi:hypothetical protein
MISITTGGAGRGACEGATSTGMIGTTGGLVAGAAAAKLAAVAAAMAPVIPAAPATLPAVQSAPRRRARSRSVALYLLAISVVAAAVPAVVRTGRGRWRAARWGCARRRRAGWHHHRGSRLGRRRTRHRRPWRGIGDLDEAMHRGEAGRRGIELGRCQWPLACSHRYRLSAWPERLEWPSPGRGSQPGRRPCGGHQGADTQQRRSA